MIKFHSTPLNEIPTESKCENGEIPLLTNSAGLLERLVTSVRDSLGVELPPCTTISEDQYPEEQLSERTGKHPKALNGKILALTFIFSLTI